MDISYRLTQGGLFENVLIFCLMPQFSSFCSFFALIFCALLGVGDITVLFLFSTRIVLLANTWSVHKKKVKMQEDNWLVSYMLHRQLSSNPSQVQKWKTFLRNQSDVFTAVKSMLPNILTHLAVFVPVLVVYRIQSNYSRDRIEAAHE